MAYDTLASGCTPAMGTLEIRVTATNAAGRTRQLPHLHISPIALDQCDAPASYNSATAANGITRQTVAGCGHGVWSIRDLGELRTRKDTSGVPVAVAELG